ncbi:hypothetical protein BZA77DRAFT_337392 [Pyronema omphalodes]|nr:hypothetical protein BZA77DRAFT_337392 [Pyronema omphalodes]
MTSQMVDIHTPGLKWWLTHLETEFHSTDSVDRYIDALKRRSIRNPTPAAVGTAQLCLRLIGSHKFTTIGNLVDYVLTIEAKLSTARPKEMSIRNMVRRVLGIIREEAENNGQLAMFNAAMEASEAREEAPKTPSSASRPTILTSHASFVGTNQAARTSLFNIFNVHSPQALSTVTTPLHSGVNTPVHYLPPGTSPHITKDIKPAVMQDIRELVDELESSDSAIAEFGPQLLPRNEIVMTYGLPPLIHKLLLKAAHKKDHDFTVVVVEGSPNIMKQTHAAFMNKGSLSDEDEEAEEQTATRKSLQDRGVQMILIPDSNIYNFIPRVNKVLLAANYVLADGSVVTTSGSLNLARAAKAYNKPVVVLAGSHTLCPVTTYNPENFIEYGPPPAIHSSDGDLLSMANFPNPLQDFIKPDFVTMFVTNNGINPKETINRTTLDLYHMTEPDLV